MQQYYVPYNKTDRDMFCSNNCEETNVQDCPGPWEVYKNEDVGLEEDEDFLITCGILP